MTIKVGDRLPDGQLQEFIEVETAGWACAASASRCWSTTAW